LNLNKSSPADSAETRREEKNEMIRMFINYSAKISDICGKQIKVLQILQINSEKSTIK